MKNKENLHGKWEKRGNKLHCSYCGSLHPDEFIKLINTPNTEFSGSDWKYGWPHKFYINNLKFYNIHLSELNKEKLNELASRIKEVFGIFFIIDKEKGLGYICPKTKSFYGYQLYGWIGEDLKPNFGIRNEKV